MVGRKESRGGNEKVTTSGVDDGYEQVEDNSEQVEEGSELVGEGSEPIGIDELVEVKSKVSAKEKKEKLAMLKEQEIN